MTVVAIYSSRGNQKGTGPGNDPSAQLAGKREQRPPQDEWMNRWMAHASSRFSANDRRRVVDSELAFLVWHCNLSCVLSNQVARVDLTSSSRSERNGYSTYSSPYSGRTYCSVPLSTKNMMIPRPLLAVLPLRVGHWIQSELVTALSLSGTTDARNRNDSRSDGQRREQISRNRAMHASVMSRTPGLESVKLRLLMADRNTINVAALSPS